MRGTCLPHSTTQARTHGTLWNWTRQLMRSEPRAPGQASAREVGRKGRRIVSRNTQSIWPGVRIKKAKGRSYFYWTRVPKGTPCVALPNPYTDADGFMRKMALLQRVADRAEDRRTTGTFGALVAAYRETPKYTKKAPSTRKIYDL